ncbi:MAG: deoxyguanosinetriphosphate triphosphohydrolase [Roseiarcus sp.]
MSHFRAPWASDPNASRGRLCPEPSSPTRTEFQRDRDRIVHSTTFRRLAYKTQVFVHAEGDHFRTRLTHTIEVAQIARALARALKLDDDLAEAVALAHDLGHTPFGHTGEDALDACMREHGGFEHNSQALRIVTELERRYADFDGLNLTADTLQGLVKHNGPLVDAERRPTARWRERGVPKVILAYDARHNLALSLQPSLEAQAAALADDIAYNAHDIDDGLRAGLFAIDDMRAIAFVDALVAEVDRRHPGLEPARRVHELTRRVITRFIDDAIAESERRLGEAGVASLADVEAAGGALVAFSPPLEAADRDIKTFLFVHMYRHAEVQRVREKADAMLRALFSAYCAAPSEMSAAWAEGACRGDAPRVVADYIAGMTDRFALKEYRRLFDAQANLR